MKWIILLVSVMVIHVVVKKIERLYQFNYSRKIKIEKTNIFQQIVWKCFRCNPSINCTNETQFVKFIFFQWRKSKIHFNGILLRIFIKNKQKLHPSIPFTYTSLSLSICLSFNLNLSSFSFFFSFSRNSFLPVFAAGARKLQLQ